MLENLISLETHALKYTMRGDKWAGYLFLDVAAAFPSVSQQFLKEALKFLGFPPAEPGARLFLCCAFILIRRTRFRFYLTRPRGGVSLGSNFTSQLAPPTSPFFPSHSCSCDPVTSTLGLSSAASGVSAPSRGLAWSLTTTPESSPSGAAAADDEPVGFRLRSDDAIIEHSAKPKPKPEPEPDFVWRRHSYIYIYR